SNILAHAEHAGDCSPLLLRHLVRQHGDLHGQQGIESHLSEAPAHQDQWDGRGEGDMSKPMVPVITPPTIQGRRMPRRERVRSLSLPKSGLATRAKIAPMPRMSERSPASPFASICAMCRGRATIIGVSSAIQVPKYAAAYAAMKTGPTRRVGAGASALTRSGPV